MTKIDLSDLTAFVPETMALLNTRVQLLNQIANQQMVGRRSLASQLGWSERLVRSELDKLKDLDLINLSSKGVTLNGKGKKMLSLFIESLDQGQRLDYLASEIKNRFGIAHCLVVAGDSDQDANVMIRMGQALSNLLDQILPKGQVVLSVTGGTTIANVVQAIRPDLAADRQFTIVPARGGGRGELAIQANTVSFLLANQLQGISKALFVPEQISSNSRKSLLEDPDIAHTIKLLKKSNCLIYSVGDATIMAERRGASAKEQEQIRKGHAVGEAMGAFFDKEGHIVFRLARIGLVLDDLFNLPSEVLVAGGSNKRDAVSAYLKLAPKKTSLVLDEALANLVLKEATL